MKFLKTYKSGARLVVDHKLGERGTSIFICFTVGAKDESPEERGISHFVEHLMFKSTNKRESTQISEDIEFLGTFPNAMTSHYSTKYVFTSLKENFEKSLEIYADMLMNGKFLEEEIDQERTVVLEEMKRSKDSASKQLYNAIKKEFHINSPYANDVLGDEDVIKNVKREQIIAYIKKHYTAKNMIISIAGGTGIFKAKKLVKKYFGKFLQGQDVHSEYLPFEFNEIKKHIVIVEKDEKQAKVSMKFKGLSYTDPDYYSQSLMASILGGGMSSRMYKEIREKLGLVYSIDSSGYFDLNYGGIMIDYATSTENIKIIMPRIRKIIEDIAENGISPLELQKVKNRRLALIFLSRENRSYGLAAEHLYEVYSRVKYRTDSQVIKKIKQITVEDIKAYAKRMLQEKHYVFGAIGLDIKMEDMQAYFEEPKEIDSSTKD